MQEDTVHISTTEYNPHNQADSQEPQIKPFKCRYCPLIFKSKVYLFEHLNKVHGLDVDVALTDAGLKQPGTHQTKTETKSNNPGDTYECQHCSFKALSLDVLDEHEKVCQGKSEIQNGDPNQVISEKPNTKILFVLETHPEAVESKEGTSVSTLKSTSKNDGTLNSSKDLKTYKRPMQTITKYLVPLPGHEETSPVLSENKSKPSDGTKETLILQESPSNSRPNSSGVFKVTAKPTIDITTKSDSTRFLLGDPFPGANLKPKKPQGQAAVTNNVEKRLKSGISGGPQVKKAKISFEFSEGEEEKNLEDMDVEKVYSCKHCDFGTRSFGLLSNHYQKKHPYIRYNAAYLQDPTDQSYTFRCLVCPVEFSHFAELESHYTESHPEALHPLTMQSFDHNLVFKCFVCQFTSDALKALKKHYKEKHPTYQVINSLMYCRYVSSKPQENKGLQLTECKKAPCPEEREVRKTPSPQQPSSTGENASLYQCNNCSFAHKSVIVMHVHYQRSHPNEVVTIDKIKQLTRVSSNAKRQESSDKPPDSVIDKSNLIVSSTDSQIAKNEEDRTQKRIKLCLKKPASPLETPKPQPELPKNMKVESAKDGQEATKAPTPQKKSDLDRLPVSSSSAAIFYCQLCSYSNTNIKSVVGHYNAKHSDHERTDVVEVALYSQKMQERKQIQESLCTTPSDFKTHEQAEVCGEPEPRDMKEESKERPVGEPNAYACPENLFYCEKCNLANPTVKGVLNHQVKLHKDIPINRERIIKHTALIRDQMKKSTENDSAHHLPLPILNKGETDVFFCHLCNYRHSVMREVLRHYFTRHPRFKVGDEKIRKYSSQIYEKLKSYSQSAPENQEVIKDSLVGKGGKKTKTKEQSKVSESPSTTESQMERTLKCRRCPYKTQQIYLFRRHMRQIHQESRTVKDILRMCYKRGIIEAGYHCDMCVFSHPTAEAIFKHYRKKHSKQFSLEYVKAKLHVGLKSPKFKLKKQTDCSDENNIESQTKVFSCKACSYKSDSLSDITQHYRAVHPWSVKEDGSVLDVTDSRKPGANKLPEDHSDTSVTFDKYQIPIEFENSTDSMGKVTASFKKFRCHHCPAKYYSQSRLDTHLKLKHKEAESKNLNKHREEKGQIQQRLHVFKCLHCTFVNTNYHGILTHYQMRHHGLELSIDSVTIDVDKFFNMRNCLKKKGQSVRLSGYMCNLCPQIFAKLERLNSHHSKSHHETGVESVAEEPQIPPKPSGVKTQTQAKLRSNQGLKSKATFLKNNSKMIRCTHCAYKCTTKLGLGRHLLLRHSSASAAKVDDHPYKCALCSNAYFRKKTLGTHYAKRHGKESFVKYFLPLKKQMDKKPWLTTPDCFIAQQIKNNSEVRNDRTVAEKNKITVFKCPKCSYVNASYIGLLTHCSKSHPGLTARADHLQVEEVLVTNIIGFSDEMSNHRGYRCKMCPYIYVSIKKLKAHSKRDHGKTEATTPKLVLKIKKEKKKQADGSHQTVLEAFSVENDTSAVSCRETDLSHKSDTPETAQSNTSLKRDKDMLYQCHICNYKAWVRRYLQSHYRKFHKIDVLTTFKLLEKYNKRKTMTETIQPETKSEESATVECKKCPNLTLDSPEQLISHFSTAHNSDRILDFIVLSKASKRSTGLYKCLHCRKQLNGIRKTCYHLDRHRETETMKTNKKKTETLGVTTTTLMDKFVDTELPVVETLEELAEWNGEPVETLDMPTSPQSSPVKPIGPTDPEQPDEDSTREVPTCKQCGRTFMSLKGLRSHERSHAAFAAIKKHTLPDTVPRNKMNKYIIYKSGTTKPFVCSFCSYRTNVMGLWKRHFMRHHQDVLDDPNESEDQDEDSTQSDAEPNSTEECSDLPDIEEKAETNKRSTYAEPPDVQRQLDQYSLLAQAGTSSRTSLKETMSPEDTLLHCELCSFSTGHLRSIRRHYVNRHGKKPIKCKDCEYFTHSRKNLDMHMERDHSDCQPEPTQQRDFCCPFCLYQTKNKNHMIDHIILHREERLEPIQVRRPKLSRYLQGIVFRCHNCTFTCGSSKNLRLHVIKHHDIKPYKCRLCFFDCTLLSDLEAHLSDKHQVMRNHELVGQVSLDQLEAKGSSMLEDEEEPTSDSEHYNSDREVVKTEDVFIDCDEALQETLAKNPDSIIIKDKITFKVEDTYQEEGVDGSERNGEGSEGLLSDLQHDNIKNSSSDEEIHEWEQEEIKARFMPDTEGAQDTENIKDQNVNERMDSEDDAGSEKERRTPENMAQTMLGESTDSSITLENNTMAQQSFALEKDPVPLMPSSAQLKISHVESLCVSSTNCNEEQVNKQKSKEVRDPYGEMPVLEKEYLRDEKDSIDNWQKGDHTYHLKEGWDSTNRSCKDETDGCTDQEQDEGDAIKDVDKPSVPQDGAAENPDPITAEEKRFTCELCGRNLMNSFDLQRHVVRHGM